MNTINIKDVKFIKEVPVMLVLKIKDVVIIAVIMFILGFIFGVCSLSHIEETQANNTEIIEENK